MVEDLELGLEGLMACGVVKRRSDVEQAQRHHKDDGGAELPAVSPQRSEGDQYSARGGERECADAMSERVQQLFAMQGAGDVCVHAVIPVVAIAGGGECRTGPARAS